MLRRDPRALRDVHGPRPQRQRMAGQPGRLGGGGPPLPLPVDLPHPHLAPLRRAGLRGQPARPRDHERRPELGGHQPRSDLGRRDQATKDGRAHTRRLESHVRGGPLRHRRVARRGGRDLGGVQRRAHSRDPRRRRDVDERYGEHPGSSAVGHVQQHRAVTFRGRRRLCERRSAPAR